MQCFWQLGPANLQWCARTLGVAWEAGASLVENLAALIRCILPDLSETELLEILEKRTSTAPFAELLAALDDVEELVAKEDLSDFHKEQKDVITEAATKRTYNDAWQALKINISQKRRGGDGQAKAITDSCGKRYPERYPGGDLTTTEAARFAAPGCKIYKDPINCRWQLYFYGQSRSRAFLLYGPDEACRLILEESWKMYFFKECLTEESCPVSGIFRSRCGVGSSAGADAGPSS